MALKKSFMRNNNNTKPTHQQTTTTPVLKIFGTTTPTTNPTTTEPSNDNSNKLFVFGLHNGNNNNTIIPRTEHPTMMKKSLKGKNDNKQISLPSFLSFTNNLSTSTTSTTTPTAVDDNNTEPINEDEFPDNTSTDISSITSINDNDIDEINNKTIYAIDNGETIYNETIDYADDYNNIDEINNKAIVYNDLEAMQEAVEEAIVYDYKKPEELIATDNNRNNERDTIEQNNEGTNTIERNNEGTNTIERNNEGTNYANTIDRHRTNNEAVPHLIESRSEIKSHSGIQSLFHFANYEPMRVQSTEIENYEPMRVQPTKITTTRDDTKPP